MKKLLLLPLFLCGCDWVYNVPPPRQASTQLSCFVFQSPTYYSTGEIDVSVLRCHDPVMNSDFEVVIPKR